MLLSEGAHITDIADTYPDPSKLSLEQLAENKDNLSIDGRIYQVPHGLSDDGGIDELEERLSLEALVARTLRTGLTFQERQVVGLKSGLNGRGPHTVQEIANKMDLTPVEVVHLRGSARRTMAPRVHLSVYDVIDEGKRVWLP
jgi:hypothetical protein